MENMENMVKWYKSQSDTYRRIVKRDSWDELFRCLTRLIVIEVDFSDENVKTLHQLSKLAEDVKEKTSDKHHDKNFVPKMEPLRCCTGVKEDCL